MTSTAGIVGSASKGIGFLSGDAEYVRKRNLKNQQDRASRKGIMEGFIGGGESVVSGFASGISGLVTKPYEEVNGLLYCILVLKDVLKCMILSCNVLSCIVLYCTIMYCTVVYYTVLYCTVLYCTVLYCTVLHDFAPYYSTPSRSTSSISLHNSATH